MSTLGVILAGGLARRMGGGDKLTRTVAGQTVLERVLDRLGPQVDRIVVNANGDPARFAPLTVIADTVPDNPGPLAGVLAAFEWAATQAPEVDALVTLPGDAPFIPCDLVERLLAAIGESPMACAASGGRVHHVVGLWPVGLRQSLRAALESGLRKVGRFTEKAAIVEWPTEPVDPFFNVNTPEDLAEAELLAANYCRGP